MSDSRVRRLIAAGMVTDEPGTHLTEWVPAEENAADLIEQIEIAGLLVVDYSDPAVIDRVAEVHRVHANLRGGRVMHCRCGEASPDQYGATRWHSGHVARAVLAALSEPGTGSASGSAAADRVGADQPEPPVSLSVQRRLDVMRGDRDE